MNIQLDFMQYRFSKYLITSLLAFLLYGLGGYTSTSDVKEIIYVGTFEGRGSEGLYVFELDRQTMQMEQIQVVSDHTDANFQALHPSGNYLYSVSGNNFEEDTNHGTITSYRIDSKTGKLTLINEQSVEGRGPAHLSVDPLGKFAYVSNYGEGNLSVFKIDENGALSEAVDVIQHEGSSINERRQNAPHVHSVIPSGDGRFIYVSDLGIDQVVIYEVNRETGKLASAEIPYVENTPGAGPRHFTIHPNGNFAYSAEELSSTVAVFSVNNENGALSEIQRVHMLPEEFEENNSAADIHISPDGQFLYASNRGHDSLVIFKIDGETGNLNLVSHQSTHGGHPRNFLIDRDGDFVLVANRDNDNVVAFRRNKSTGTLTFTGEEITVPMAVCITQYIIE